MTKPIPPDPAEDPTVSIIAEFKIDSPVNGKIIDGLGKVSGVGRGRISHKMTRVSPMAVGGVQAGCGDCGDRNGIGAGTAPLVCVRPTVVSAPA